VELSIVHGASLGVFPLASVTAGLEWGADKKLFQSLSRESYVSADAYEDTKETNKTQHY